MDTIRIALMGGYSVGKKSFIGAVHEEDFVTGADRRIPLPETPRELFPRSVFGRITLNDDTVMYLLSSDHPNGFPGQFLDEGARILCLFVDSSNINSLYEGQALLKREGLFKSFPYIIVANKQDCEDALTVGQIRREMQLPDETIILPCVATERASVANVLNTLLPMIRPDLQERIR